METRGVGRSPRAKMRVGVTARTNAKLALGKSVVYFADLWCGNIGEGIQCLLGMDFMVRAGVRLSAYDGAVRLPDKETVPLVSAGPRPLLTKRVSVASAEDLYVAPGMSARVPVVYGNNADLVVWLCRGDDWLTTLIYDDRNRPSVVRVVNVAKKPVVISARSAVAYLVERDHLPPSSDRAAPVLYYGGYRNGSQSTLKVSTWTT